MHFDGGFTDECRGRTFTLSGGVAADAISSTAKFGSGSLSTGAPMPITSTADWADFDFGYGAFTVEAFVRRSGSISGPVIEFSNDITSMYGLPLWQLSFGGEGGASPFFQHFDPIYGPQVADVLSLVPVDEWTHVAVVSGAGQSTLRIYVAGSLAGTRYRGSMPTGSGGTLTIHGHSNRLVDDLRVLPAEVYTGSSFTPPTSALTPTV